MTPAANQTRCVGLTVQISQSDAACWSPGFGSLNGAVSMCTSDGFRMAPDCDGSVIVGAFGDRFCAARQPPTNAIDRTV